MDPSPVEVSEVLETPQSLISNNFLPMNPSPVEESESSVSSSNEQVEHLPENKDDEFKKAKEVKIKFG